MATAAKFRIDVGIHDLLTNSPQRPPAPAEDEKENQPDLAVKWLVSVWW
jgi:hypothetical protein